MDIVWASFLRIGFKLKMSITDQKKIFSVIGTNILYY